MMASSFAAPIAPQRGAGSVPASASSLGLSSFSGARILAATPPPKRHGGCRRVVGTPARAAMEVEKGESRGSLIPETLEEMKTDEEYLAANKRLEEMGQAALTKEERAERRRALDNLGLPNFDALCAEEGVAPLRRLPTTIFQINIGLYCNQACSHCHVESSPLRTEAMDRKTAKRVIELLAASDTVTTLDITGGAPELSPEFRWVVSEARKLGVEVIDRCNLTVLREEGQEDLAQFLADNQVRVVASLPCYTPSTVDGQRGRGVFERSIQGLQDLNALGYGKEGSGLMLDLVYNPSGDFLPPPQENLITAYKQELGDAWGIEFNNLFTITNMPIKRFADFLVREGKMESYMELLVGSFNPAAVPGVMCTGTVSVGWDGRMYDCDFNQQLAMEMKGPHAGRSIFDINSLSDLTGAPICTDSHCFGCTAGAGSSCQGETV